jgi:hypothetical protein
MGLSFQSVPPLASHKVLSFSSPKMEMLPNDLLMVITKKIAAFGTQDLMNLGAKLRHQLANKKAAFHHGWITG